MAIILPKQGSIWETLGGGLGSGLQRLAQGKVQQMQKQGYANSLQQMGMSPDIAYLPENLQPLAMKQYYKGLEALGKKDQDEALFQQGVSLGGDPEMLRQAHAAGNLSQVVGKLTNAENPSYAQRGGLTSSKTNQFRLSPEKQKVNQLAQELSGSSGVEALQNMGQQQSGLSGLSSQVNESQGFTPAEQILMQKMKDPNIPAEKRQEMREALQAAKGRDWGYGIGAVAGSIGNFASNAMSSIGSGFNMLPLAESATNAFLDALPGTEKYKKPLEEIIKSTDPESDAYKDAQRQLNIINKYDESKAAQKRIFPTSTEIKEDFVRPLASALGIEKHIDPKNPLETFFGRLGGVAPIVAISSLMGGGPAAANLLRQAGVASFAEGTGQLTEAITGSKLAGNVTSLFSYMLPGLVKPGFFKNIIGNAYKSFEGLLGKNQHAKINTASLLEELQPLREAITIDAESAANKFLSGRLRAIDKIIKQSHPSSAPFGNANPTANPNDLFKLDKVFGKQFDNAEKLNVSSEFQQMREAVRKMYQQWGASIDPTVTNELISARAAEQSLRSNSMLEKALTSTANAKVPIFSQAGHAIKSVARMLKYPAKYGKLYMNNATARGEINKLLKAAANDNKAGMYEAGQRAYKEIMKKK